MYGLTGSMQGSQYWDTFGGKYWQTMPGSYASKRMRYEARGRTYGSAAGGIIGGIGGMASGMAIGSAIGTAAAPIIGTVIGAVLGAAAGYIGGYLGGEAGAGLGRGAAKASRWWSGYNAEPEFKLPFVNTRTAATMRQSAMQSMMNSAAQYRSILGREAARMHR